MVRKVYQQVAEEVRREIQANIGNYPLVRNRDTLKGGCQNAALLAYHQLIKQGTVPKILKLYIARGKSLWDRGTHIVVASPHKIIDPTITQYTATTQYAYYRNQYPLNNIVVRTEDVTNSPIFGLNPV